MMANITEDYVSFETAKLLKEKGFLANDRIHKAYNLKDKSLINSDGNFNYDTEIPAPTHQMAMKWLRVVHNIYISIEPHALTNGIACSYECLYWYKGKYYYPYSSEQHELHGKVWNTCEDALNEIIKYVLTNYVI